MPVSFCMWITGANDMTEDLKVIGSSPLRLDVVEKVTGKAMYSADDHPAELAYTKLLLSPYSHDGFLALIPQRRSGYSAFGGF